MRPLASVVAAIQKAWRTAVERDDDPDTGFATRVRQIVERDRYEVIHQIDAHPSGDTPQTPPRRPTAHLPARFVRVTHLRPADPVAEPAETDPLRP